MVLLHLIFLEAQDVHDSGARCVERWVVGMLDAGAWAVQPVLRGSAPGILTNGYSLPRPLQEDHDWHSVDKLAVRMRAHLARWHETISPQHPVRKLTR
jgi:hypothetical protein